MSAPLKAAHYQWANRPADETFSSVAELARHLAERRASSRTSDYDVADLRVEAADGDLRLVGKSGQPASLTNWSMAQLAQRAGAPPSYLAKLPATLAGQCLNHGLSKYKAEAKDDDRKLSLLFRKNGVYNLRAAVTPAYSRIWDVDVAQKALALEASGQWKLPLAYVRKPGTRGWEGLTNEMAPRGAYAGDRDMFLFLVNEGATLKVDGDGNEKGVNRGFFLWNSEVGSTSFGVTTFLYDMVCGNHYVWNPTNVKTMRVRHVGDANQRGWSELSSSLNTFAFASAAEDEAAIRAARTVQLGKTAEEIAQILSVKIPSLSLKAVTVAYKLADETPRYGNPRTAWAIASGLTELSQALGNADERTAQDRAAGKVLALALK